MPKGNLLKQYLPSGVINVVSRVQSSSKGICQNPLAASRLEKTANVTNVQDISRLPPHYGKAPKRGKNDFTGVLSKFEQQEVKEYQNQKEVWFLGNYNDKIHGSKKFTQNCGYDDKYGFYKAVPHDHLAYRYELLSLVGRGSFSNVYSCFDHKWERNVAIKVIGQKESAASEIKILETLQKKDTRKRNNIIHMKNYFHFRNHLCICFPHMGEDLITVMKNKGHGFTIDQVRGYAVQLLKSLKKLRKLKIVHGDLKPGNILTSRRSLETIKVCDFGVAFVIPDLSCNTSVGFGTRPYMAPEHLLKEGQTTASDMWSLGCTLAQLHTGRLLFRNKTKDKALPCISKVLGDPAKIQDVKFGRKNLARILNTKDALFLDFLMACLKYDPKERMRPDQMMEHPWIQGQETQKAGP
ncbi:dual specificity tyrosine-phosphorylation-regulated kinase 4-like [Diretmus argenteus]